MAESSFICSVCQIRCNSSRLLSDHMKNCHSTTSEGQLNTVFPQTESPNNLGQRNLSTFVAVSQSSTRPGTVTSQEANGAMGGVPDCSDDYLRRQGNCFICNVSLTSRQQTTDHFNSERHKKKKAIYQQRLQTPQSMHYPTLQVQHNPADNNQVKICSICRVPLSGDLNVEQHFAGRNHKKKMMELGNSSSAMSNFERDTNQETEVKRLSDIIPNTLHREEPVSTPVHENRPRNASSEENDVAINLEDSINECTDQIEQLSINMLSPVRNDNLTGNNTDKESLKDKKVTVSVSGTFYSDSSQNTSINTALSSIIDNYEQPNRLTLVTENSETRTVPKSERQDPHHMDQERNRSAINNERQLSPAHSGILNNVPVVTKSQDYEYWWNGMKGYCIACEVDLTSLQLALQHLNGQPHQKKTKRWKERRSMLLKSEERANPVNQSPVPQPGLPFIERLNSQPHGQYPLWCEPCQKPFSGQESAHDHFISRKHFVNQSLLSTPVRKQLDGARIVYWEGNEWYFCEICRKALNTMEMLEIHKTSPQHLMRQKSNQDRTNSNSTPVAENSLRIPITQHEDVSQLRHAGEMLISQSHGGPLQAENFNFVNQSGMLAYAQSPVINTDFTPPSQLNLNQQIFTHPTNLDNSTLSNTGSNSHFFPSLSGNYTTCNNSGTSLASSQISPMISEVKTGASPFSEGEDKNNQTTYRGSLSCASDAASSMNFSGQSRPNVQTGSPEDSLQRELSTEQDGLRLIVGRQRDQINRGRSFLQGRFQRSTTIEKEDDDPEEDGNAVSVPLNIHGEEKKEEATVTQNMPTSGSQHAVEVAASTVVPRYYCQLCKTQMNKKKCYDEHMNGAQHQWKLSSTRAPQRTHDAIVKSCNENHEDVYDKIETTPRNYQLTLLNKALLTDCLVYLPTGTGKTMVAILTMAMMLEKNPSRPVIFLVDKVLLVIQQARYIQNEFKDKKFTRFSLQGNSGELVKRELNLAFICGSLLCCNNMYLWQHDIIVTTVDYCINMLSKEIIHWKDFSLAVFDEVHHCIKKHPFNRLIKDYHLGIDAFERRPKILGLTASPAGKSSTDATYKMLQELLQSLGGAHLAFIEDTDRELKSYRSIPNFHTICVSMTNRSQHFLTQCIDYFLRCFAKLSPCFRDKTDVPFSYFLPVIQNPNPSAEDFKKVSDNLVRDTGPLRDILPVIFHAPFLDCQMADETTFNILRLHLVDVILHIEDIPTGVDFLQLKKEVEDTPSNQKLQCIRSLGLPCDIFYQQIVAFEKDEGSAEPPMMERLMQILQDPSFINWNSRDSKALVLVKERKQAKALAAKIQHKEFVRSNSLRVTALVGHGQGKKDGGMKVKEQKGVLDNQNKYNILVATSIAEEGVDLKNLALVVCMNPPSNITAFVQIRGRTRKSGSHFVIICGSEEEKGKLEQLELQEKFMMEAAQRIAQDQANQTPSEL